MEQPEMTQVSESRVETGWPASDLQRETYQRTRAIVEAREKIEKFVVDYLGSMAVGEVRVSNVALGVTSTHKGVFPGDVRDAVEALAQQRLITYDDAKDVISIQ